MELIITIALCVIALCEIISLVASFITYKINTRLTKKALDLRDFYNAEAEKYQKEVTEIQKTYKLTYQAYANLRARIEKIENLKTKEDETNTI